MRVKAGREWLDVGPGRAVGTRRGISADSAIGGRGVGAMVPDAPVPGPIPLRVSPELRHPNPLGMKRLPSR